MDALTMMMASQIMKTGMGFHQRMQAEKLERDYPRPTLSIPEADIERMNMLGYMASRNELPGQARMESNIDRDTSNLLGYLTETASNPTQIVQNAGKIVQSGIDKKTDLGIEASRQKRESELNLADGLKDMARRELEVFEYNEHDPFMAAMNASAGLRHASNMNIYNGVDSMGQMLGQDYYNRTGQLTPQSRQTRGFGGGGGGSDVTKQDVNNWGTFESEVLDDPRIFGY